MIVTIFIFFVALFAFGFAYLGVYEGYNALIAALTIPSAFGSAWTTFIANLMTWLLLIMVVLPLTIYVIVATNRPRQKK